MAKYDTAWWMANPDHMTNERNGPNAAAYEAQEAALRDILVTLDVQSVLEIGCGFGRVTRVAREALTAEQYTATDVSPEMLDIADRYFRAENVVFERVDLDGGPHLQPRDLVIAAEVLMHRPPEKVSADARLLASLATKYVLTVDWHENSNRYAEGCYQHDYRALFAPYGTVEEVPVPAARQAVYLTRINRGSDDGQDR